MAWVAPKSGQWFCERCGRQAAEPDGWVRLEVWEQDEKTPQRSVDFCGVCKVQVHKMVRQLAPRAVAISTEE